MLLSEETLTDPSAWAAEFETVVTESSIIDVKIPTLVVHGTADDVVPVDHATRIADRARRAERKILEGAGHQLRRDDRAITTVIEWLDRVIR